VVVAPWSESLTKAVFLKRYKRFFADIEINGCVEVAHVANTGSLIGVLRPKARALVLPSSDPSRKLKYSLKAIQSKNGDWIGVDTGIPSKILALLLKQNPNPLTPSLKTFKLEYKLNSHTRLDAMTTLDDESKLFFELKNVTMRKFDPNLASHVALFPDAVTERGQKHLLELMELVSKGHRAKLIFMVQRTDCNAFRTAHEIDANYAKLLFEASKNGVEIEAYPLKVAASGVTFIPKKLPIYF